MKINNYNVLIFYLFFIMISLTGVSLYAFQTSYFYRASYFPGEPRFQEPHLMTFKVQLAEGSTSLVRDECGNKAPLFTLFNCDKDHFPIGTFDLFEARFTLYHNLSRGFFFEHTIPVTQFTLSPFIKCNNIDLDITSKYNNCKLINGCAFTPHLTKDTEFSDCITLLGLTMNYDDCSILDYTDATLKAGILWPTSSCFKSSKNFALPNGYGYWGFPLSIDLAAGALDWLTLGLHLDTIFFLDSHKILCNDTPCLTNNTVLNKPLSLAYVEPGNVTNFSLYAKADHVIFNFSFLLGYAYSHKSKDNVDFFNNTKPCCFYNNPAHASWTMHTINILFSYDFSQENNRLAPEVDIFFNQQIAGKRVFITNMAGGVLGTTIRWCF